jgi:hypothetical protein
MSLASLPQTKWALHLLPIDASTPLVQQSLVSFELFKSLISYPSQTLP